MAESAESEGSCDGHCTHCTCRWPAPGPVAETQTDCCCALAVWGCARIRIQTLGNLFPVSHSLGVALGLSEVCSRCAERAGESSLTSSGNHFARWLRGERPLFVVGEGGGGKQHRGHMRDDLKFSTRKSCVSFCGRMDFFTSQPGVSPRISCGRVAGGLAFLASLTRTWKSCAGAPLGSPWRKADSRLTFRSPTRV
jgi:hypothetical protein